VSKAESDKLKARERAVAAAEAGVKKREVAVEQAEVDSKAAMRWLGTLNAAEASNYTGASNTSVGRCRLTPHLCT